MDIGLFSRSFVDVLSASFFALLKGKCLKLRSRCDFRAVCRLLIAVLLVWPMGCRSLLKPVASHSVNVPQPPSCARFHVCFPCNWPAEMCEEHIEPLWDEA